MDWIESSLKSVAADTLNRLARIGGRRLQLARDEIDHVTVEPKVME